MSKCKYFHEGGCVLLAVEGIPETDCPHAFLEGDNEIIYSCKANDDDLVDDDDW